MFIEAEFVILRSYISTGESATISAEMRMEVPREGGGASKDD